MAEGVVAGIDWASEVHVACVMDGDGAVTGRFSFTHDAAAVRAMIRRLSISGRSASENAVTPNLVRL